MLKTLRLILGDQLNINHSWFQTNDDSITYVIMEIRSETDYATHHIQKIAGFFSAMRNFASELKQKKHNSIYFHLNDTNNLQAFDKNLQQLINKEHYTHFEYQLPDEYRLDELLKNFCQTLSISTSVADSEHFMSTREELGNFFDGKKTFLMESFYHMMRKKHNVLMQGNKPLTGKWNYDGENRKNYPKTINQHRH
ncbi:cryptochrome/photolyase family protein [Flavobacterium psychrophilum]|nr:cryptochrome/photolyase family protein [Flavobacterium psychrophilum]